MATVFYTSVESEQIVKNGKRMGVKKMISMKNNKGVKVVRHQLGSKVKEVKQPLTRKELQNIQKGSYMPALFTPMTRSMRNKKSNMSNMSNMRKNTRKVKRSSR